MRILIRTLLLFLTGLVMLSGCGNGSESGRVFSSDSGHSDDWASPFSIGSANFHATAVKIIGSEANGPVLFARRCALCHGSGGAGRIGPNILGTDLSPTTIEIVNGAITAIPLMRGQADLSASDRQDIVDYIAGLRAGGLPVAVTFNTGLCIQCHGADLDRQGIAQVSCISCHNGLDGSLGHPVGWGDTRTDPVRFHGVYGRDFRSGCITCHGIDLNLTIMTSGVFVTPCSDCHNGVIAPVL